MQFLLLWGIFKYIHILGLPLTLVGKKQGAVPSQAELDEMKRSWCSCLEMAKTHSESDRAQQQHHRIDQTPAVDLHLESEAHGPQISELVGQSILKAPSSEYSFILSFGKQGSC